MFSEEANEAGDGEDSTREEESWGGSPEQVSIKRVILTIKC